MKSFRIQKIKSTPANERIAKNQLDLLDYERKVNFIVEFNRKIILKTVGTNEQQAAGSRSCLIHIINKSHSFFHEQIYL